MCVHWYYILSLTERKTLLQRQTPAAIRTKTIDAKVAHLPQMGTEVFKFTSCFPHRKHNKNSFKASQNYSFHSDEPLRSLQRTNAKAVELVTMSSVSMFVSPAWCCSVLKHFTASMTSSIVRVRLRYKRVMRASNIHPPYNLDPVECSWCPLRALQCLSTLLRFLNVHRCFRCFRCLVVSLSLSHT